LNSQYLYQSEARYFAQVPDGGEDVAAQELAALGAEGVRAGYRGLYFGAERRVLYAIVYRAFTISRVLAPLIRFQCHSPEYLYKRTQSIPWSDFLTPKHTFAVFATVSNSAIRHSQYAALTIKDAIVDQFREKTGARPNVETQDPDLWINLYLHANKATLSIDASGGSMHRRGYRRIGGSTDAGDGGRHHHRDVGVGWIDTVGRPHVRLGNDPVRGADALQPRSVRLLAQAFRIRAASGFRPRCVARGKE